MSPAVTGGGAPCPAHRAALDFISVALSFSSLAAFASLFLASYSAPASGSSTIGLAALAAASSLGESTAGALASLAAASSSDS
jgi:hypothetical protein